MGLLFILVILALDVWLVSHLIRDDIVPGQINFLSFLLGLVVLCSLPALAIATYQTLSCLTLRYRLDRNSVVIQWLGVVQIIPIRHVQRIVAGRDLENTVIRRRGLHWPGHERGEGAIPGIGRTRFLATRRLSDQLLLVTPGLAVAVTPHDAQGFLEAFEARRALGPNRLLEPEVQNAPWLTWPLWTDHTARVLLVAAIAVNLGLFAFLSARLPRLDPQLPLHFSSLGQADRIGTKAELLALPVIGIIILGTNLFLGLALYRRERAGSYLLWGAAVAAQVLFWFATFSILR